MWVSRLGVVAVVFGVITSAGAQAPFARQHSFTDSEWGETVQRFVLHGSDGNLYGTRWLAIQPGSRGMVVLADEIFELSRDALGNYSQLRVLHTFAARGICTDGNRPQGRLLEASDGNLYGTTTVGGGGDLGDGLCRGLGTLFRLSRGDDGHFTVFTVLHVFRGSEGPIIDGGFPGNPRRDAGADPDDGAMPAAGLIEGRDGSLYGTTFMGGTTGEGTVFRVSKDGKGRFTMVTVLHSFSLDAGAGSEPVTGLTEGPDGTLYGVMPEGIYELAHDSTGAPTVFGVLVRPDGGAEAGFPETELTLSRDGKLYGTFRGWPYTDLAQEYAAPNAGLVFQLERGADGRFTVFTVLHVGDMPAMVVEAADGTLYGLNYHGGVVNHGAIFELALDPSTGLHTRYSIQHSFLHGFPGGLMAPGADGTLYGVEGWKEPWPGGRFVPPFSIFAFTPVPALTALEYTGPDTYVIGEPLALSGRLVDADGGPAAGESIGLVVENIEATFSASCRATTDARGQGQCTPQAAPEDGGAPSPVLWVKGTALAQAQFAGNVATGRRESVSAAVRLDEISTPTGCQGCGTGGGPGLGQLFAALLIVESLRRKRNSCP